MTAAPLCLPFSQIQILEPSLIPLTSSIVTASTFDVGGTLLAVAYAGGTILLFDVVTTHKEEDNASGYPLKFRSYLTGHTSTIVSLTCCTTRTENGLDTELLLSLSIDGNLRKWSMADGRCLQAADGVLDSRPRGLSIFHLSSPPSPSSSSENPLEWLTGEYILVYGCTTAITIISAATFEAVVLWTSNTDWPLPLCFGDSSRCQVLTCTAEGAAQGWAIEKDDGSGTLAISKTHGFKLSVGNKSFGRVKAVHMLREPDSRKSSSFLIVQTKGVSVYDITSSDANGVRKLAEVEVKGGVNDAKCCAGRVWVWTQSHDIFIYSQDMKELSKAKMSPPNGHRILNVAFGGDKAGDGIVAGFCQGPSGPGTTYFGIYGENTKQFNWSTSVETAAMSEEDSRADIPPTTSCTSFSDVLVFACGDRLLIHSLSSFLLNFSKPLRTVWLETSHLAASVTLLKYVTLPEPAGTADSNFLIVGMSTGSVYVVDPITFEISPCLHLHTHPIQAVLPLPVDLAPRLRSTLLVCSVDGTSSILDISASSSKPKVRPMLCLPPAVTSSPIYAIATQAGRNLVLFIHDDGGRRLWDVDTVEGGGILIGDTTHKNHHRDSSSRHEFDPTGDFEDYDLATSLWREINLADEAASCEHLPEGVSGCCLLPSSHGTPTTIVDLRELANQLQTTNRRRSSNSSSRSTPKTAARAVLMTLLSNGKRLLSDVVSQQNGGQQQASDVEKETLSSLLSRETKSAAAVGVLGEHEHVSILSAAREKESAHPYWLSVSPHLRALMTLSVVILMRAIWPPQEGEKDQNWKTKKFVTRRLLEWSPPDESDLNVGLAVYATYWFDRQEAVREAARTCMTETLHELSRDEISNRITFWREFLPVTVSPDIFGVKEVLLSVVILGAIISACDERTETKNLIDQNCSLRRNVSVSIEFLLGDRDTFHQDSAIGLIGYGWLSWQSHFDSFEVIHTLIRIHAATATDQQRQNLTSMTLLDIATKNAPLLVSGLANCISHSVTTETSSNSSIGEIAALSMAAMKAVGYIVRENPIVFAEPELLKVIVEAIVKVLDPQAGILRDRVLSGVTGVVNELVSAYPTVAFHRPTQKLALSKAQPQAVSVFDLRSGSLSVNLEGHTRIMQFLTFSGDGKYIVGADLQANQLYVWRLGGGFLSNFMGAASVLGDSGAGTGAGALKGKYNFKNDRKVGLVKVEFTGEKTVRITAGSDVSNINI